MIKLERLTNLYLNKKNTNPNYNLFKNIETIDFYDVDKELYDMNCKLVKIKGKYKIYIIIAINKDDSSLDIIFNGVLEDNQNEIELVYEDVKKDIKELSVEQFINKYYEQILEKNNF